MPALLPTHELSADEFYRHDCQPVPKLVHMVLLLALKDRAAEITFEPQQSEYRLSYTVDGKVYDMVSPPLHLTAAISQVFKVLAELDTCNQRAAQVGKVQLLAGGGTADVLVSIWQTPNGDAVRVAIEANSTSAEEIHKQLMEYREGRRRESVPTSWLQGLWRLVRNFGRTRSYT
jgi:type II secretory ATPase GspE/PulE/Tfp pilus assembly ATPase PilB-like protein